MSNDGPYEFVGGHCGSFEGCCGCEEMFAAEVRSQNYALEILAVAVSKIGETKGRAEICLIRADRFTFLWFTPYHHHSPGSVSVPRPTDYRKSTPQ